MSQIQFNVTLDVDSPKHLEAAIHFLTVLKDGVQDEPSSPNVPIEAQKPVEEKPKRKRRSKAEIEAAKKKEEPTSAPTEKEEEKKEPAPAPEVKKEDPTPAPVEKAEEKKEPQITLVELRKFANEVVKAGGGNAAQNERRQAIKAKLTEFDAPNFTLLKEEKYDDFKAFLDGIK